MVRPTTEQDAVKFRAARRQSKKLNSHDYLRAYLGWSLARYDRVCRLLEAENQLEEKQRDAGSGVAGGGPTVWFESDGPAAGRADDAPGTITRAHLAQAIHRAMGLSQADAALLVCSVLDVMCETLGKQEPVSLPRFGKFFVVLRAPRTGRDVGRGIQLTVAAQRVVQFKAAPALKARMNSSRRPPASR